MMTAHLPGLGGRLRNKPEDFVVEEILGYDASGEGAHAYVQIRRTGQTTRSIAQQLSRLPGCGPEAIGYAGLKDKDARVTQTFSVYQPTGSLDDLRARIEDGLGLEVLSVARHGQKLKVGRLAGNRFTITISDCALNSSEAAEAKINAIKSFGLPNYFGEQRFGREMGNAERGLRVLRGVERPEPWLAKLLVSALQSEIFNEWLSLRINSGFFSRLLGGDVAARPNSTAFFLIDDVEAEQRRLDAREIAYTGPMFGHRMRRPEGRPAEMERVALQSLGGSDLERRLDARSGPSGTRRVARIFPDDLQLVGPAASVQSCTVAFVLPAGSYATVVMQELMEGRSPAAKRPLIRLSSEEMVRPRLVMVDRDGVLNEDSDNYIRSADQWIPIPGSMEALGKLHGAGIQTAVVSNQSGVGRGYFGFRELEEMHAKLRSLSGREGGRLDRILICPHVPDANCSCRKPAPGMLLDVLAQLHVEPVDAVFVGDSLKDLEAARAAGVQPIAVLTGKGEGHAERGEWPPGTPLYADFAQAVDAIIGSSSHISD